LPWPLRDLHRLDQDVIGVRLANRPITEARRPYIIATSSGALDKAAALKARTSRP
jgi:hypothetical protein